jgi:hypothetical protein
MAALYGTVTSDRSHATRCSSQHIATTAETWNAIVRVDLQRNGDCVITVTNKHGGNKQTLWEGNADETVDKSA